MPKVAPLFGGKHLGGERASYKFFREKKASNFALRRRELAQKKLNLHLDVEKLPFPSLYSYEPV